MSTPTPAPQPDAPTPQPGTPEPPPDGTAPRTAEPALYTARVDNSGGTAGQVRIREADGVDLTGASPAADGGIALPTGGPRPSASGFNPEQFLAMAWSTCLAETLKAVLSEQGLEVDSAVTVEVALHRDLAGGFRFVPRARVRLDSLSEERARELVEAAHARCPVSKLLRGTGEPVVELLAQE